MRLNPVYEEVEEGDDVMEQGDPLELSDLQSRLQVVPWLGPALAADWPGCSKNPFTDGCAAACRILLTAAAIGSTHSADLATVLGMDEAAVVALVYCMRAWNWNLTIEELQQSFEGGIDISSIQMIIGHFLDDFINASVNSWNLMKAIGLASDI